MWYTMASLQIFQTQDGSDSLFSEAYGVSYHSRYGAVQESRHVFIEAGLHHIWLHGKQASVLEIGLGTGLNAFMTMLEAENRKLPVRYTGVEAFPITLEQASMLNYPSQLDPGAEKEIFLRIHALPSGEWQKLSPCFQFRKFLSRVQDLDFSREYDLIYFDAFAPGAQPELWEYPVLEKMYQALNPGGVLVTYCAKGSFKRDLKSLGFEVQSLPGPPGKREMTRAIVSG